ncbi:MAG: helix-turn-helix domain-containing protein [Lentisphaeria bacterium]|nr:MAG: helix-turn-helix domain-containing protein [Lentisphaeria bacterium]
MQEKSIQKNCMIVESKRFCCSKKGLKRYEIAPLVGVSAYTVGQWIKAWKKGGQAALKVGNKGRPRGFTENCFRMKNGKFAVQSRIVVQIS